MEYGSAPSRANAAPIRLVPDAAVRASSFPARHAAPGDRSEALLYGMGPPGFLEWNARRFGDTFRLRSDIFGDQVCVSRPEAIKEVFTGDPETMHAGEANVLIRPIVGDHSVLLQDGAAHLRKRRLILPPFHGGRMTAYTKVMVEETERAMASWRRGQTVALRPLSQHVARRHPARRLRDGRRRGAERARHSPFVRGSTSPANRSRASRS